MELPEGLEQRLIKHLPDFLATRPSVDRVLEDLKSMMSDVRDVRFRPVDWRGQAVVYVNKWSTEDPKEGRFPEVLRRVFFRPNQPEKYSQEEIDRIDGVVGLVARICQTFLLEKHGDSVLAPNVNTRIEKLLRQGFEDGKPKYLFCNLDEVEVFKLAKKRFEKSKKEKEDRKKEWESFKSGIIEPKGEKFKKKARELLQGVSEKESQRWIMAAVFSEHTNKEEVLEAVNRTIKYYNDAIGAWEYFINNLDGMNHEIAVPVVIDDKLYGILNLHSKDELGIEDVNICQYHAALIAVAILYHKTKVLKQLQNIGTKMTMKTALMAIATEISFGIKTALHGQNEISQNKEDGTNKEVVYPLLYICRKPISANDNIDDIRSLKDNFFYQEREVPKDEHGQALWEKEQELSKMPMRNHGLGYAAIGKWQKAQSDLKSSINANEYFTVAPEVDNPDSLKGSKSACDLGIRTTGCLPLVLNNQIYGLLYLHYSEHHFFTQIELEALETFAVQAAVAINNAQAIGHSYEELYGKALIKRLAGEE
jgi:putative methionine-R-sulfoxide reductase with GAF domain